jgi:IS30 family transposase
MAPRQALQKIPINRVSGHQLSIDDRAQIVGAVKCGATQAKIYKILNFTRLTVSTTIKKDSIRHAN